MKNLSLIIKRCGDLQRFAKAPAFWVHNTETLKPVLDTLKQGVIKTIGSTAGGREILAIEYGVKEPLDKINDCLHSAIASNVVPPDPTQIYPESFYGKNRRRRPVLAIQGGIHGGEATAAVAAINLCKIIETGRDMRGKEWPRLAELARETRLLIIPWLNTDGVDRWPIGNPEGVTGEILGLCTQGVAMDGTYIQYPQDKNYYPTPPEKMSFLGCYYNDNGCNLQYDFCMPVRQPETIAWMNYYLAERPDAVMSCHCDSGSMISAPEYYLPTGHQFETARLGGAVRSRLLRENFPIGRLSWAGLPGMGKPILTQTGAIYHVCGALPFLCEFPYGGPLKCEQLLDIGLITFEEVLAYAHRDGLRPYELWDKVKKRLE